ncbi:MAG: 50S ribosomal protein L23 [Bacteroidales bacterium]|jgi:large subunit ribosomal protein L23|nr:50S ribosomal protein L23 [Bacteroidales bacterium]
MSVIVKPLVTEKMNQITEKFGNKYGFIVEKKADKAQIKKAVEELYGVKVVSVNTMIAPAKKRSRYTKAGIINGRVPSYKKAIVTLAEGETIDFYSNI